MAQYPEDTVRNFPYMASLCRKYFGFQNNGNIEENQKGHVKCHTKEMLTVKCVGSVFYLSKILVEHMMN